MTRNRRLVIALTALALTAPARMTLADKAGLMQRTRAMESPARRAEELLAEARLHAELGRYQEAAAAYRRLFDDADQPPLVRGRARLGEGVMLRALGKELEFLGCFFEVIEMARAERSVELAREIVSTEGGVLPAASSWEAMEPWLAFERLSYAQGREVLVRPPGFTPRVVTEVRRLDGEIEVLMESAALGVDPRYTGAPISVSFKDADMQDLFRMFKQVSGLNIIIDSEVRGMTVTLDVTDTPWDEVMALVMRTHGLGSSFERNVLRVAPLEKISREVDQEQAIEDFKAVARAMGVDRGTEATSAPAYTGQPISVSFKDADITDLFQVFGEISGQRILVDPSVHGETITIDVHEVPWDQVMALVLKTTGLEARLVGDTIRIVRGRGAPSVRGIKTVTAIDSSGETGSIARTLSHADGQLTLERVKAQLSPRGTVILDRRTNTLIVKDLVPRLADIEQLLDELDVDSGSGGAFTGQPISVSFRGADVPDLFRMFAQISGLDIRLDDRAKGPPWDVAVEDKPWDAVLDGLLTEHGLVMVEHEGRHFVLPRPADDRPVGTFIAGDEITILARPADGW